MSKRAVSVFISYSHKDREYCDELKTQLVPLVDEELLDPWYDGELKPGQEWEALLTQKLHEANIILLLVSPDFLASDYCRKIEIPEAFRRNKEQQTPVIPLILRQCQWKRTSIANLQVLPRDGVPLNTFDDRDSAWSDIVDRLAEAAKECEMRQASPVKSPIGGEGAADGEPQLSKVIPPEIVRLLDNVPEIRKRIEKVADYKHLHDGLHEIQMLCLKPLLRESQRQGEFDAPSRQCLAECARDWRSTMDDLEVVFTRATLADRADWLIPLRDLCDEFSRTHRSLDRSRAVGIVDELRVTLGSKMSIVDNLLRDAARELDLARVVSALHTVREWAPGAGWSVPRISQVTELESRLRDLQAEFERLVQEHGQWQNLEDLFRSIEVDGARMPQRLPERLRQSWSPLSRYFNRLRDMGALLGELNESVTELANAVQEANEPRIHDGFVTCRALAGQRFFKVDLRLRKLCEELRLAGEPLQVVVSDVVPL